MARVNISIPDELYQQLQEIRDSLNMSAICQEALSREVARREPLPADMEVTDEIVERLRSEREDYERESRERGFLVGMEWARRAKFPSVRQWGKYKPRSQEQLADLDTPPYDVVEWIFESGENLGGGKAAVDRVMQSHPELKHLPVVWEYSSAVGEIFWFEALLLALEGVHSNSEPRPTRSW